MSSQFYVYALSDLHTDFPENKQWVEQLPNFGPNSLLIVAGDISDDLSVLQSTLQFLKTRFADVAFVPGNHDLWVREKNTAVDSFQKYNLLIDWCRSVGILVDPVELFGGKLLLVPLPSWYDGSLFVRAPWEPEGIERSSDPHSWDRWNDTKYCNWLGKSLDEVVDNFHTLAEANIGAALDRIATPSGTRGTAPPRVVAFSHFFSSIEQVEPLMEAAKVLLATPQKNFPPNFSSIAGSSRLHTLLMKLEPDVFVYGHSHRPADFMSKFGTLKTGKKVRMVNAPLSYPSERAQGHSSTSHLGESGLVPLLEL